jgi:hypothetical protein
MAGFQRVAVMTHKEQVKRARKAYDKAVDAIYKFAPNDTTKFNDCLALATTEAAMNLESARSQLNDAEYTAIAAGKAYRESFGSLTWYR